MMAFSKTYHEDSDADDEFERSAASPALPPEFDRSPSDSDPPSAEHTPTLYGYHRDDRMPETVIADWTAEECADYISSLGLPQYAGAFMGMLDARWSSATSLLRVIRADLVRL